MLWSSSEADLKLAETLFIPELCIFGVSICAWLISGYRQKSWVGTVSSGFLFSQGSHPASRNIKPCVPVEAFLSRGHVDVDGFLEWQLSKASGTVCYFLLLPSDGVVILPNMLCYC